MNPRLYAPVAVLALFLAANADADFGRYESHALSGNTLTVRSDRGELHLTAIDDAAFEVHYVEPGVRQLPSFALTDELKHNPPAIQTVVSESPSEIAFALPELTAVVSKSPVKRRVSEATVESNSSPRNTATTLTTRYAAFASRSTTARRSSAPGSV